jgi:hypothetical protein
MDANDFYLTLFAQIVNHEKLPHPGSEIFVIEALDRKTKAIRFSRQPWDPKNQAHKTKQYFQFKELDRYWNALAPFWGKSVTTESLKQDCPDVFSSKKKGYNCMAIFLFMLLQKIGMVKEITGKGLPGEPFAVELPADPEAALNAAASTAPAEPVLEETPETPEASETPASDPEAPAQL